MNEYEEHTCDECGGPCDCGYSKTDCITCDMCLDDDGEFEDDDEGMLEEEDIVHL